MSWWKRATLDKGWHPVWILVGLILVAIAAAYVVIVAKSHSLLIALPAFPGIDAPNDKTKAYNEAVIALSAQYGQMGDAVGGLLNPILTFLSCVGLLITIIVSLHAVGETRELAAKQQRNEKLSTMISVLTTLYQAASEDYEYFRSASGNGPSFAAQARKRMKEIKELLNTLYLQLHREDFPEELVPKSILSEELARQKEGPTGAAGFSTTIRMSADVQARYSKILKALAGKIYMHPRDDEGPAPNDSGHSN